MSGFPLLLFIFEKYNTQVSIKHSRLQIGTDNLPK